MISLPQVKLKDCVDLLAGFAFKSQYFTESEEDIPLIKGENVSQGHILWEISKRWPASEWEALAKYQLKSGDVIVAMDRPWVPAGLKWAYIRADHPKSLLVQRCARLRSKTSILDQDFLRFIIGGQGFESYVKPITTGVNVPHISGKQILDYCFALPPIAAQQRIAGILSAYDELIENSQRRINILEAMALGLYREWFVHFRFPGHENHPRVASALGEIPQGWEVRALAELCSRMESGGTPRRNKGEYWESGEIDWYKTGELWDGFLFGSQERITVRGQRESTARLFEPGTILMAIYGSPTVGRMGILTRAASCNQAALGLVAHIKLISQTYLYFVLFSLREHFNSLAQGAAQQNISKEKVASALAILPRRDILERFDRKAEPIFLQIQTLQRQVQNLRRTRDLLLPRLLSGQISVGTKEVIT